jgi:uncharacterized protein
VKPCTILLLLASSMVRAGVPVVDAAQAKSYAKVEALLAGGVNVNQAEPDGTTALHWAAHYGNSQLVAKLLNACAKPNVHNEYGSSPLSEAATYGNTELIRMLLNAGADPNSPNQDGQTALMIIARTPNIEAARLLIERGADINATEHYRGQTALMWAAAQKQSAMVQELVKHGAQVNARSAVNNWERQVTAEPRAVYRPAGGLTPLLFAAREGCAECARHLAEAGADLNLPDPEGVTPLIAAVTNGHFDTAKYFVEKGVNVNKFDVYGRTPLYEAVDQNTLPHGGRPDWPSTDKTTGLQMMELLLKSGAYPDPELKLAQPYRFVATDRGRDGMLVTGTTPLIRAAKGMDAAAIKLLLAAGAQIDLANSRDFLPIIVAAGVGSGENDTRGWFNTPDVQQRSIAALRALLDAGANIEAKGGQRGQPALHGAASWGWNDVVQFLVDRGAAINSKDARGMTALDAALGRAGGNGRGGQQTEGHADTAKLIEKLGGVAGTPPPAPGPRTGR